MTRREALRMMAMGAGCAAAGGTLLTVGARFAHATEPGLLGSIDRWRVPLPIPPAVDLTSGGSRTITMAGARHTFHPALPDVPTFGYGGATYLGPVLVVRSGVPVALTFRNALGSHPLASAIVAEADGGIAGVLAADRTAPRAAVHVHGGKTPPQYDGHPYDWLPSGAAKTYVYPNGQDAATVWFHDHALGITRLNVYAGLAGGYVIRDDKDTGGRTNFAGLPFGYGTYELPLILQDKSFASDASGVRLDYPPRDPVVPGAPALWVPEFFGDVAIVNGAAWPTTSVTRSLYRMRIINGSQARFWNLRLTGGARMFQIGTDQGLLDAPVDVSPGLLLAPGERADVLFDFRAVAGGTACVLTNDAPVPYPGGGGGPDIPELCRFVVSGSSGPFQVLPTRLRPDRLPVLAGTRVSALRNVTLMEQTDADDNPLRVLVNNLGFDATFADASKQVLANRNTVEQWNIVNLTGDTHPMHLHLAPFQLLERAPIDVDAYVAAYGIVVGDGRAAFGSGNAFSPDRFLAGTASPPSPNERGWKDTIQCPPGQVTRILVSFKNIAFDPDAGYRTAAGTTVRGYVWHCHILEHEENDMMNAYRVV